MKKFWIIKKAPVENNQDDLLVKDGNCICYATKEKAERKAMERTNSGQGCFVVLELVSAFRPKSNVERIEIED
jgi:hypothetical protein